MSVGITRSNNWKNCEVIWRETFCKKKNENFIYYSRFPHTLQQPQVLITEAGIVESV